MHTAWLLLIVAGLFEAGWAVGLKFTHGWTRPLPTAWTVGAMLVSVWLLGQAARTLPIGSAYAVWTGIGALGTALVGIIFLNESRDWLRLASLGLILIGLVGVRVSQS